MSIKQTIERIKRMYLDTAPLIYYIEDQEKYQHSTHYIFDKIDEGKIRVVTSSILLSEVLVMPIRKGLEQEILNYCQIVTENTDFSIFDKEAAIEAARLRAINNPLKMPDAQHLAIAIQSNCDSFLTNDIKLKNVTGLPDTLKIIILQELENELNS